MTRRSTRCKPESGGNFHKEDQRALAIFAADCAEHVLPIFAETYPQDERPQKAVAAARAWARGEILCGAGRSAAIAAHAAAREAGEIAACAAARAAGHAAATAHMIGHARHAAAYAVKASIAAGIPAETERAWQLQRLPEHLRAAVLPADIAAISQDLR